MNKTPKYCIGDVLYLNTDLEFKRQIIQVYCDKEIGYYTKIINDDIYPPSYMEESRIDTYYTKTSNKIEIKSI
jgi:hypothetical protein